MMEWQGPHVFLNKLYREVQTGKEWMWVSFVAKDLKCDGVRSLYKNIKILIVTKSLTTSIYQYVSPIQIYFSQRFLIRLKN